MGELRKIDHERRLYVIGHGTFVTCLGFEVAHRRATAVAAWCGAPPPDPAHIGTAAGFNECRRALAAGEAFAGRTKSRCDAELHRQLIGLEGRRVAVVDADGQPDRFWVGKSTGWLPCHLRVHSRRSHGGPPVDSRPFQQVTVLR